MTHERSSHSFSELKKEGFLLQELELQVFCENGRVHVFAAMTEVKNMKEKGIESSLTVYMYSNICMQ